MFSYILFAKQGKERTVHEEDTWVQQSLDIYGRHHESRGDHGKYCMRNTICLLFRSKRISNRMSFPKEKYYMHPILQTRMAWHPSYITPEPVLYLAYIAKTTGNINLSYFQDFYHSCHYEWSDNNLLSLLVFCFFPCSHYVVFPSQLRRWQLITRVGEKFWLFNTWKLHNVCEYCGMSGLYKYISAIQSD